MLSHLRFLILFSVVFTSSCHRYKSKCKVENSTVVSYAVDIQKGNFDQITTIIEYSGVSLVSSCFGPQDFFIAKRYNVSNYTLTATGSIHANVTLLTTNMIIDDIQRIRGKRVKCSFKLRESSVYDIKGLSCLYRGKNILQEYQDDPGKTEYYLQRNNDKYILPDSQRELKFACDNCECFLASGIPSSAISWIFFGSIIILCIVCNSFLKLTMKWHKLE